MYDVVGDIHGHADELEALLKRHGYEPSGKGFRHPERTLIFLGDIIDRGKQIKRAVEIVRSMVDSGAAKIVMGNHEFNAICYHTPDPRRDGEYLRSRSPAHVKQHEETLAAFPEPGEMKELLEWFYTIPMWLELPELRAVHACWDVESLALLRQSFPDAKLTPDLLAECAKKEGALYHPIEHVLKGPEARLPGEINFKDKEGVVRRDIRLRWYLPSEGQTYRSYSFPEQPNAPETPIPNVSRVGYAADERPVFFGHYWLRDPRPSPMSENCFCLDYSVAKEGFLCGYRLGEGFLL